MAVHHTCDVCRVHLDHQRSTLTVGAAPPGARSDRWLRPLIDPPRLDLCPACVRELLALLDRLKARHEPRQQGLGLHDTAREPVVA
jgi:hypothetical protein